MLNNLGGGGGRDEDKVKFFSTQIQKKSILQQIEQKKSVLGRLCPVKI